MPHTERLDITVDTENISEGAYQILGHLRPEWRKADVHIQVHIFKLFFNHHLFSYECE